LLLLLKLKNWCATKRRSYNQAVRLASAPQLGCTTYLSLANKYPPPFTLLTQLTSQPRDAGIWSASSGRKGTLRRRGCILLSKVKSGCGIYPTSPTRHSPTQKMPSHSPPSPNPPPSKRPRKDSHDDNSPNSAASNAQSPIADHSADVSASAPGGAKAGQSSNFRNVSACNRCRLRKNRCDQKLPSCASCAKAGVACVGYDPITKKEIPRR
jgi:hypothetical protein